MCESSTPIKRFSIAAHDLDPLVRLLIHKHNAQKPPYGNWDGYDFESPQHKIESWLWHQIGAHRGERPFMATSEEVDFLIAEMSRVAPNVAGGDAAFCERFLSELLGHIAAAAPPASGETGEED